LTLDSGLARGNYGSAGLLSLSLSSVNVLDKSSLPLPLPSLRLPRGSTSTIAPEQISPNAARTSTTEYCEVGTILVARMVGLPLAFSSLLHVFSLRAVVARVCACVCRCVGLVLGCYRRLPHTCLTIDRHLSSSRSTTISAHLCKRVALASLQNDSSTLSSSPFTIHRHHQQKQQRQRHQRHYNRH